MVPEQLLSKASLLLSQLPAEMAFLPEVEAEATTRGKRLMVLSPALGKDPSRGSVCPQSECQWWVQGDFPKTRAVLSNVQRLTDPSAKDSSWRKSTQMQTLRHPHFYSFWPGHVGDGRLPH